MDGHLESRGARTAVMPVAERLGDDLGTRPDPVQAGLEGGADGRTLEMRPAGQIELVTQSGKPPSRNRPSRATRSAINRANALKRWDRVRAAKRSQSDQIELPVMQVVGGYAKQRQLAGIAHLSQQSQSHARRAMALLSSTFVDQA